MNKTSKIPQPFVEGPFVATPPFDKVCRDDIYYRVTANRTVEDFRRDKLDPQRLVFDPAGIKAAEAESIINELEDLKGVIVTLAPYSGESIHIPSTYFESYPLLDGVRLDRIVVYGDLGAVPETLVENTNVLKQVVEDAIKLHMGIENPTVNIGTVQTRGYISQEQFELFEVARTNRIESNQTLLGDKLRLEEELAKEKLYSKYLEDQIKELSKKK